jgi:hypothetical protein
MSMGGELERRRNRLSAFGFVISKVSESLAV